MAEPDAQGIVVPGDFANFYLEKTLGHGGMGGVYLGRDKMLDRPVAIKVMLKSLGADALFVERFKKEAQAAARLNHPHISQIYSFDLQDGQPYIAMELVSGGSLDKMMEKQQGTLDPVWLMNIGRQLAEGLMEAAKSNLVHGDMKPENVLFDEAGNSKIVDFGLAAMQGDSDEIWGTPYYISPEKVKRQKVDYRADIYSLGATLYHAMTGVPPFEGVDAITVVKARIGGVPRLPSEVRPDIPKDIDPILMRMLEEEPARRYPTYESLLGDFKRFLSKNRPVAAPVGAGKMRMKAKMTLRKGAPGSSAACLAASANAARMPDGSAIPERFRLDAPAKKEKSLGGMVALAIGGVVLAIGGLAGGLLWYLHSTKVDELNDFKAQIVVQRDKAQASIEKTVKACEDYRANFQALCGRAVTEINDGMGNLRKQMSPEVAEVAMAMLQPPPSQELLDAIAFSNEVAQARAEMAAAEAAAERKRLMAEAMKNGDTDTLARLELEERQAKKAASGDDEDDEEEARPKKKKKKAKVKAAEEDDEEEAEADEDDEEEARPKKKKKKAKAKADDEEEEDEESAPKKKKKKVRRADDADAEAEAQLAADEAEAEGKDPEAAKAEAKAKLGAGEDPAEPAEEEKPAEPEKPAVEVPEEIKTAVTAFQQLWPDVYTCQAAEIRVNAKIDDILLEAKKAAKFIVPDEELAVLALGDEAGKENIKMRTEKLGKMTGELYAMLDEVKSMKCVDQAQRKAGVVKSKSETVVKTAVNALARAKAKAEKEAADKEAAEKAAAEKAAKEAAYKALVESEQALAKEKFSKLATSLIKSLNWDLAIKQIQALEDDAKSREGREAFAVERRKVEFMKSVQDLFIKHAKGYKFRNGAVVTATDARYITLVRPVAKGAKMSTGKPEAIEWDRFYQKNHGMLNELIIKFVEKGRAEPVKLGKLEWSNDMLGAALLMRTLFADDPAVEKRVPDLVKKAVQQFEPCARHAAKMFPDLEIAAPTEE